MNLAKDVIEGKTASLLRRSGGGEAVPQRREKETPQGSPSSERVEQFSRQGMVFQDGPRLEDCGKVNDSEVDAGGRKSMIAHISAAGIA